MEYWTNVATPESFLCYVYVSALQEVFFQAWTPVQIQTGPDLQDVGGISIIGLRDSLGQQQGNSVSCVFQIAYVAWW